METYLFGILKIRVPRREIQFHTFINVFSTFFRSNDNSNKLLLMYLVLMNLSLSLFSTGNTDCNELIEFKLRLPPLTDFHRSIQVVNVL